MDELSVNTQLLEKASKKGLLYMFVDLHDNIGVILHCWVTSRYRFTRWFQAVPQLRQEELWQKPKHIHDIYIYDSSY